MINNNFGVNEKITYITNIDGRKIQWIALIKNDVVVFGKLQTKKKNIIRGDNIRIIHYRTNGNKEGYLQMIECKDLSCNMGKQENNLCIIEGKKEECLLLKGQRSNKSINGEKYIVLEQNKRNILMEMKNLYKRLKDIQDEHFINLEPQVLI